MKPTVSISDSAGPALVAIAAQVKDKDGLLRVLGRRTANELKAHFRWKEQTEPNKRGWPRQHFWSQVAQSVFTNIPGKTSVRVGIGHQAIAQKLYGGTITAKRRKYLALPLTAEAYGTSPREARWKDRLRYMESKKGSKLLVIDHGKGEIEPVFLLLRSVTQAPTKNALPSLPTLGAKLVKDAQGHLDREMAKAASLPPQKI